MENFSIMKSFETPNNLDENVPNFLFFDISFSFLIGADFLKNITVISVFHDQTK